MVLENILNQNQQDVKFTVINKGIPSITTTHIVNRLPQYLQEYQPHMVVTMMGINDTPDQKNPWIYRLEKFRIFKLVRLLSKHIQYKIKEFRSTHSSKTKLVEVEASLEKNPNSQDLTRLAGIYRLQNDLDKEEKTLLKALALDPNNFEALWSLGIYYKRLGKYKDAAEALEKSVSLIPDALTEAKIQVYADLAECYKLNRQYEDARKTYFRAIQYLPEHPGAYGCLADLYLEQERYEEAEQLLQKQLEIHPQGVLWYGKLAHCYRRKGQPLTAQKLLEQSIIINPQAAVLYAELGQSLLENKDYAQAEEVLKKALELQSKEFNGVNLDINQNLLIAYQSQGKQELAQKLKAKLDAEAYNLTTKDNYEKLKKALMKKNIQLVAVQYPTRNIEPLRNMLELDKNVIFVDNERIFKDVIQKGQYDLYFTDRFAGDFGHSTPEGNRLLAGNIAKAILENQTKFIKK